MIIFDKTFIKNSFNFLYKQSVEFIKQNLENYDGWILKNYKTDQSLKEFKEYKVKEIKPKTLITMGGKMTFKKRKYYKINPKTGKKEYIFILDKILGIEKWHRIDNSVKEKILSFIIEKKRYQDILDTMEHVKISLMTISNIMKNAKTDEEYYINKTNKKNRYSTHLIYPNEWYLFENVRYNKTRKKKDKKTHDSINCTMLGLMKKNIL